MELVYAIEKVDLERIREHLKKEEMYVMLGIINIGTNIALRYSDLSKLKFEDIDNGYNIVIKEKKTDKIRKIKLNKKCVEELSMLKKYYQNKGIEAKGYIFKSFYNAYLKRKIDKPLTIQSVNRKFKKIQRELGIKYNLGTHSLRKTWGYYYYKKTKDVGTIMQILNHSSEKTTLKYIGITQKKIDKIFEEFII